MLVHLMYVSRAREGLSPTALEDIQQQSKRHNQGAGITGVLCLADGLFIQVLEGERRAVNALYGRLARDDRHQDLTLLVYREVVERRYGNWTMGRVDPGRINPASVLKHSVSSRLDPYALPAASTAALFEELLGAAAVTG